MVLIHATDVAPAGLRVAVSQQGTTTTIHPEGEFDLTAKETMDAAVRQALQRRPEKVVLDLSRVSFIDSSGIHVVIELAKRSARQNAYLVIIPGAPQVQRVFEICHLTEVLPFIDQP
jgi:anti-anti-sigma factor